MYFLFWDTNVESDLEGHVAPIIYIVLNTNIARGIQAIITKQNHLTYAQWIQ